MSQSQVFVDADDAQMYLNQISEASEQDVEEEVEEVQPTKKTHVCKLMDWIDSKDDDDDDQSNGKVMYTTAMCTGSKQYKTIDYDQIDSFDFEHTPFIEVVQKPEYVHFYIDSDNIETREEYDEFYTWLESLKPHFGKYVIGGYTINNELFGDLYKCQPKHKNPKENHTLSLHVAFYQTKLKASTLMKIMTCKQTRGEDGKMKERTYHSIHDASFVLSRACKHLDHKTC